MATAIITGVTGQDGSYLAEQLLAQGYRVVGLHRRLSADNHWRIAHLQAQLELRSVDLLDQGSLLDVFEDVQPDEIYNLAAQSFVPTSWRQPILTGEVTGLGALRVLEAMKRACPSARLYQASSSEMFGAAEAAPQTERTPLRPRSPYAVAKTFAHYSALNYRDAYGLFVVCGILFNHESPRRGLEFVTRKVTDAVARIHLGLSDSLSLGELSVRRDWGYAPDYTEAMQAMLRQDSPRDYVVASGKDHSVEDLVAVAFGVVDRDWRDHVHIEPALFRNNELPGLCGDATRAAEDLDWAPKVDFETMIDIMVRADIERLDCGS
ncbi:MAG: GDP-mannose 4,6-dehydratase [Myxococcota bacterium]|nr:GDP-mannose 4,6-dehydratase [Myxococcota bacterium]